jgi:WD40 repeat protein
VARRRPQLATADAGKKIRAWNLADGQQVASLEGHAAAVQALVYAPDGTLLSGAADGQIKVWNIAEKKEIASTTVLRSSEWRSSPRALHGNGRRRRRSKLGSSPIVNRWPRSPPRLAD